MSGKGDSDSVTGDSVVLEFSEHTLLREYRHCGATVEATVNKLF